MLRFFSYLFILWRGAFYFSKFHQSSAWKRFYLVVKKLEVLMKVLSEHFLTEILSKKILFKKKK